MRNRNLPRCRDCKHYKPENVRVGECTRAPHEVWTMRHDAAWGLHHAHGHGGSSDDPTTIHCGPMFGCIHHEPKGPG